ncbi:hypothetical protein KKH18_09405 [bacterium]|nr:hypothetical protein [bacterium]
MKPEKHSLIRTTIRSPFLNSERWFVVAALAAAVWYVLPLFDEPLAWGSTRDWGYFFFLEEVTRKTILEFAQMPLWNPYYFGGAEHLANPQSTVLSPTTLLTLMMGTALGLKLGVALFVLIGVTGMYRLARHWGASAAGACLSGLIYGCSGWFAQHVGGGHWGFAAVSLYPWIALFFLKGLDRFHCFAFAAIGGAWVAVHWGVYTLPWLFMILGVIAAGESAAKKNFRPIAALLGLGASVFALAAVRLLPVLEYINRFPRATVDHDRMGLDDLLYVLMIRHSDRLFADHGWEWPEYGNYLGWAVALLLLASFWFRFQRKTILWMGAAFFLLLSLGKWSWFAPYSLLSNLPLFENLRVPSRYTLSALFFLAPIAGLALTALQNSIRGRLPNRLGIYLAQGAGLILLLGILLDPVNFNRRQFEQSFHLPPPTDQVSETFQQRRGDPNRMYAYPRVNQGSVLGLEESPLPQSEALRIDAEYQYLLASPEEAHCEQTWWSPNELRFYVNTPQENLLVINQNFRDSWRVEGDFRLENHRGLLAVELPTGEHQVALAYKPASFSYGFTLSFLAWIGLIIWYYRSRKGT